MLEYLHHSKVRGEVFLKGIRYSVETGGAHVTKELFPGLIAKLWETSFEPSHCKSGFQGTGLYPLSREHVLQKLEHTSSKATSASHPADTTGSTTTSGPANTSGPWLHLVL